MKLFMNPKIKYWIAPILFIISLIVAISQKYYQGVDVFQALINTYQHIGYFGIPYCLVGVGAGLVIAAGGVDLSSMGVATLSGVIFAVTYQAGMPILVCVLFAIAIGFIFGYFNGIMISWRSAPPLIFTWAVSIILFSLSRVISNGNIFHLENISQPSPSGIDLDISTIPSNNLMYIIFFILLSISMLIFMGIVSKSIAIGSNRNSSLYYGLKVKSNIRLTYILSGMFSAIAGIFLVFHSGSASAIELKNQELIPIAIAVLAGTSLSGGSLNLISVFLASFFWANLDCIINTMKPGGNLQQEKLYLFFSIILLLIVSILGKKISGETISVQVEQKIKE
jgi:ribose/xylose/arabinose/galactoside ABC-type transport system permease subunit